MSGPNCVTQRHRNGAVLMPDNFVLKYTIVFLQTELSFHSYPLAWCIATADVSTYL
jgi:hypothetical protein